MTYVFSTGCRNLYQRVSPFGYPRIIRLYTAPRGFSQCPTSFFGIWRLGIHRKLLVASSCDAETSNLFLDFFFSFLSFTSLPVRLLRCSPELRPGSALTA